MDDTEPVTSRAEARVGTVLKNKWRLDALVGVGGMAVVYAATHRNSKRVAVKMLHPELSLDESVRQRFLREGYLANQVGQRGAVAVDDDDTTEDGAAFLVMELLDGETLETRMLRKGGRLAAAELLSVMDQVLCTLRAAHEKGIVHRDLKPENLFLTRDSVVKILDFGIARIRELSGPSSATQAGSLMGTPSFMAPEQARARWDDVDARTDIWAIGATMFTLLTGRFVHEAETVTEALVMAVTERAPPLSSVLPDADAAVAGLVDRALAYEREGRFQTALEMQTALRAAYLALVGDETMAPLSVPEAAPSPVLPFAASGLTPKPATLTTGRGVSASVAEDPAREGAPREKPAISLLVPVALAAAALFFLGAGVLLGRGHGAPPPSSAKAAVAAPAEIRAHETPGVVEAAPPASTPSAAATARGDLSALDVAPKGRPLASGSRKSASRGASPTPASIFTSKPRAGSPAADPFARRH